MSNHSYGTLRSDPIAVLPGATYTLSAWVRGKLNAQASGYAWALRLLAYDRQGAFISSYTVASGGGGSLTTAWQQRSGTVTLPGNATTVRAELFDYMTDGWVAMDDVSLTGATVTKYYYLGSQRVAMRQGGVLTYLHGDHLGSASLATDVSGAKVSEQHYLPYGGTRSGEMPTDRQYTGQRREASLGFYDYVARQYDPTLGRFLQADTIIPDPANPQSLNRYSYVLNSPLRYTDPSGHEPVTFAVVGLFALAGAAGSGIGYVVAQTALGNPIDPTELGVVIGTGAIAGALTPVASLAGLVGIGIGANVANEILPALIKGEPVDPVRTVIAGGIGGIFGLGGGVVGGGSDAIEQYLGRRAVQPLCEAIGPASAELGKEMLRRASEELVREGAREGARTAVSEFFSNINVDTLTQWFD